MTPPVSDTMRRRILSELADIEAKEDARILFAVESGSRAWGFHSTDSDYDVRFVYVRPVDWHLSLKPGRDVIERPVDAVLDVSGWDLRKALNLALGSNAVISEWLQSPIRYIADEEAVGVLTAFTRKALDRRSVTWHYLSLLKRQRARLIGPEGGVRLKRYFYCLRPALTLRWMRLKLSAMPPMDMETLMAGCDLDGAIRSLADDLIALKKRVTEQREEGASVPGLDRMIAFEQQAAEEWLNFNAKSVPEPDLIGAAEAIHRSYVRALG